MNDRELQEELKKHYRQILGEPSAVDITWIKIAPQLREHGQGRSWWRSLFPARGVASEQKHLAGKKPATLRAGYSIRIAFVIFMIGLMTIGAAGYATTGNGPLGDLLKYLGLNQIENQFSDYHQSKNIDGYTITIQKVYADTNRVIIGYTGEAPGGANLYGKLSLGGSKLSTEQGVELRPMEGVSSTEQINGNLFDFDASTIQGRPKELHLRLAIPYGSQPRSAPFQVDGYLNFAFTVPFHIGRVLEENQAVTASGTPITKQITALENGQPVKRQVVTLNGRTVILKKVSISASEVRAYIQGFDRPYPSIGSHISYSLKVDGRTYNSALVFTGSEIWQVNFDEAELATKKGVWVLQIQQIIPQLEAKTGKSEAEAVPGAVWSFQFQVS